MKKFAIILIMLLIPVFGYSQDKKDEKKEDVTVVINLSKIGKAVGDVAKFIKNEAKQFKEEAEAGITEEQKEQYKEAKKNVKKELKYWHDAIHAGWAQGWKGEDYTPPYEHK